MVVRRRSVCFIFLVCWSPSQVLSAQQPAAKSAEAVDFQRDVRPILSNNCLQRHLWRQKPETARRLTGLLEKYQREGRSDARRRE